MQIYLLIAIALLLANLAVVLALFLRRQADPVSDLTNQLTLIEKAQERSEKALRDEIAKNRDESSASARQGRDELSTSLQCFRDSLIKHLAEIASLQKQQLDTFANQLTALTQSNQQNLELLRRSMEEKLALLQGDAQRNAARNREESAATLKSFTETFVGRLDAMGKANELKIEQMRQTIESKLTLLQQDTAAKLEVMRATVDEKLHATLEQRLGESFKLVSERLELVHKGLGEMQNLANGVGDLKKVLTNVKTRGNWGEVQLGNLLEQMLTPDQYAANVQVNPSTLDRVEFAIRLPGRDSSAGNGKPVWLPIDAKFPQEDYQRLIEAADRGDAEGVNTCAAALESRICGEARKIREKYVCLPHTTDFAIMFLPTEGLFAEVLRRPGLCDGILHDHRIVLTGPTTLAAVLSSLQMGFRTLAIEQRSSEVWNVLSAVKTEFSKFGEVLEKVQKKLQEASNTIDTAATRSRAVERKLKGVEAMPVEQAATVLGPLDPLELT